MDRKDRYKMMISRLPWLILLLGVDGFAAILLWLIDAESFAAVSLLILLLSIGLFAGIYLYTSYIEQRRQKALEQFLYDPSKVNEEELLQCSSAYEEKKIRLLASVLRAKDQELASAKAELNDYEEYVEEWAHEVKTPLSLLVMVMDNRSDEMSPAVLSRLNYIRSGIAENVSQILFYARLKSANKDYLFAWVGIRACVEEVLEDYRPVMEEKQFDVEIRLPDTEVFTDERGLRFILGQLISNALKYCSDQPKLWITLQEEEGRTVLSVKDNGIGVKHCDLPYIFGKGFTGDSKDRRKKATGMGLYLSGRMAEDLKIDLEARSEEGKGFEMRVVFPVIDKTYMEAKDDE